MRWHSISSMQASYYADTQAIVVIRARLLIGSIGCRSFVSVLSKPH